MSRFHADYERHPWRKVPLSKLTTPMAGLVCYGPAWWAVTHDGFALFYGSSPQCNRVKEIVERIRPDCTPQFIEMAFIPRRD